MITALARDGITGLELIRLHMAAAA